MATQRPSFFRRTNFWMLIAAAIVAGVAGIYAGTSRFTPAPAAEGVVEQFFQTALPDAEGTPIDMGRFRAKTVVINFWAPWCAPCVEEMPELTALSEAVAAKNIHFVGIGIDSAQNIREFSTKVAVSYPLAVAGFGGTELARAFGNEIGALPFTVIVTPEGNISYRKTGQVTQAELKTALGI